jgi:hypothetical protein
VQPAKISGILIRFPREPAMKSKLAAITNRFLLAALFLALTATISAQEPRPGPPADRTNPERVRQQDISRREWQLRNFGLEPKGGSDQRRIQALAEQIEQDFSRILVLHNKIVRAISAEQQLDYHFVSDATDEIRKRAIRLQATLALREQESQENSEKSGELNQAQIKAALLMLCKQIKNFVTNPVIEAPGTINIEELARARRDLEKIIALSDRIQKDAEKLDKTTK